MVLRVQGNKVPVYFSQIESAQDAIKTLRTDMAPLVVAEDQVETDSAPEANVAMRRESASTSDIASEVRVSDPTRGYGTVLGDATSETWNVRFDNGSTWYLPARGLTVSRGVVARIVTGPHDANRQDSHRPMRYDIGRPRAVIRLRISQPMTASLPCPAGLRARRPSPMMDLYRKNVFSTRL